MNFNFKKEVIYMLNFFYALSILSLCISVLMIIIYGITLGFSSIVNNLHKLSLILGIPIVILLFTKFLSKKLKNDI